MTRDEYENLDYNDRMLVKEGYLDGYKAALECVASIEQKIGDPIVDTLFVSNKDAIVSILKSTYDKLNK